MSHSPTYHRDPVSGKECAPGGLGVALVINGRTVCPESEQVEDYRLFAAVKPDRIVSVEVIRDSLTSCGARYPRAIVIKTR